MLYCWRGLVDHRRRRGQQTDKPICCSEGALHAQRQRPHCTHSDSHLTGWAQAPLSKRGEPCAATVRGKLLMFYCDVDGDLHHLLQGANADEWQHHYVKNFVSGVVACRDGQLMLRQDTRGKSAELYYITHKRAVMRVVVTDCRPAKYAAQHVAAASEWGGAGGPQSRTCILSALAAQCLRSASSTSLRKESVTKGLTVQSTHCRWASSTTGRGLSEDYNRNTRKMTPSSNIASIISHNRLVVAVYICLSFTDTCVQLST